MTNLRFAVTSRSAAFSSPACALRASRRSSSASVMRGSFWMSWRYWSNAVEGDERKKPLDLLSVVVCIHAPVGLLAQALFGSHHLYWAHNSYGVMFGQQPRFMPKRIVIFPPILHSRRRVFGLRSARSRQNPDSDEDDDADGNPRCRDAEQVR